MRDEATYHTDYLLLYPPTSQLTICEVSVVLQVRSQSNFPYEHACSYVHFSVHLAETLVGSHTRKQTLLDKTYKPIEEAESIHKMW